MLRAVVLVLVLGSVVTACGEKQDPLGPDSGIDEDVTYGVQIAPILDASCVGCHATDKQGAARNGARVGFDYDTYEAAAATANEANVEIQSGSMPIGGSLTADHKSLFQAWVDQGTPE